MDQLRALKYFISLVAESGSFTQSAEQFDVPPSSLSRRIADLEKALGPRFCSARPYVVKLTEVGRDYYQHVEPLVQGANAVWMNLCAVTIPNRWER